MRVLAQGLADDVPVCEACQSADSQLTSYYLSKLDGSRSRLADGDGLLDFILTTVHCGGSAG